MRKKIILGVMSIVTILTVNTLTTFAAPASDGHMPGMDAKTTTPATEADRNTFKNLWEKAFKEADFTPEQTARLATELEAASKKLADNYKVLSDLLEKKKTAKPNETAKIDKRLDLTEAERDLIASQTKLKLGEFLSEEQAKLVFMATFHGTSLSLSGEAHMKSMESDNSQDQKANMGMVTKENSAAKDSMEPKENQEAKEQARMALMKAVEKLNQNCEAVTIDIIRTSLDQAEPPMPSKATEM